MVDREASGGSRLRKGGRSRHRAGLDLEHLEVVVEGEDIPPPADRPFVGGDELRSVEELDGLRTEEDGHLPPGESDRDRVAALADTDPCLRVHPVLRAEPHVEGLSGERPQFGPLDGEVLADAHRAPEDVAVIVGLVARFAELVQLRKGLDPGHRDEASSSKASHLAFHAALLVRALHAGDAEERVEAVVRAQRHEPLALGAVPSRRTLVTAEVRLSYLMSSGRPPKASAALT